MMSKNSLINERIRFLDENVGFDYILEINDGNRFTEVVTKMGGDVITHRIYGDNPNNFMITER